MNLRKKTNCRPYLETLEARQLLSVYADFNGDGFDDLAIGVPGEQAGRGMVQVLYGSANGLTATGSQIFTQDSLGTDSSEPDDNFGASLAGGDFNDDGRADLAVGVPGEDIGAATDAGLVHFVLGSANGLTGAGDYVMHQDINRVRDIAETGDFFGKSLAAGDWNSDGFCDLGVGVPGQDLPGKVDAGGVHIFYSGGTGIKPPGNQTFNLDSPGMAGTASAGDIYGSALTAGDYNGDGRADLAIGVPLNDRFQFVDAGGLGVILGSPTGMTPVGSQFHETTSGAGCQVALALASGDFNSDGKDDVAAGAPFSPAGAASVSGILMIFEGTATGLVQAGTGYNQSLFGESDENDDRFGFALTSGDFDSDGFDDFAIGVPGEDHSTKIDNGAVIVVFGNPTGPAFSDFVTLSQTTAGNNEEADDHFGEALAARDFNGDGEADIAIGTPDEDVSTVVDAGAVYVLYGGATFTSGQTWSQDIAGIADTAEAGDSFGGGLDAGAGKSAPGGGSERHDLAQLISADFELESLLTKPNKRRFPNGRR